MSTVQRRQILVDELEYIALRRFYELDRKMDKHGKTWHIKDVEKWLYEMETLREAIGLLGLTELPPPEDRGKLGNLTLEL